MTNDYPIAAFYFKVEFGLDGITNNNSSFQEVSGIKLKAEISEIVEGEENTYIHKLPQAIKDPNLVLKRGFLSDPKIAAWIEDILFKDFSSPITPTEVLVSLLNEENKPQAIWKFDSAYPIKLDQTALQAKRDQIEIERLELVYTTVTRML